MKAVYFIATNTDYGHVSLNVWNILKDEGILADKADFDFDGQPVYRYIKEGNEFWFVSTDRALCLDYPRWLPHMNAHFADFDMSAMVTWHEGGNAPANVLTVHSLGDVNSGNYGPASPKYMHNLFWAYEAQRTALGLENYHVSTEATHWSGAYGHDSDPALLLQFPVPMVDIEVGSDPSSWDDHAACTALARTLLHVFDDDGKKLHNILYIGGVHFEPSARDAVFMEWGDGECYGVSHMIANQWLVAGEYENEDGFNKVLNCVRAIDGGVEAVFFHDKLKGCYKDLARRLETELGIPAYKHQKIRSPQELSFKKAEL